MVCRKYHFEQVQLGSRSYRASNVVEHCELVGFDDL